MFENAFYLYIWIARCLMVISLGHFPLKPCTYWFIVLWVWILLWRSLRSPWFFLLYLLACMYQASFLTGCLKKKNSFLWNSVTGSELCFSFNNSTFLRTQGSLSVCKISSSLFSDKFSAIIYLNCFSVPFDFLLLRNLFCLCCIFFAQCFYLYFLQLFIQFLFSFEFTGILSSMFSMSKFQFSAGFSSFFIDWLNNLAL